MRRLLLLLCALAAGLVALTACGVPEPTPGAGPPRAAAAAEQKGPAGRLLFVRGGNVWQWAGGQETQLTKAGADSQPRWSPDGSAFLFVRAGQSFTDLWLATDQGQTLRQLTHNQPKGGQPESQDYVLHTAMLSGPSWVHMADGSDRIVYSTDAGANPENLTAKTATPLTLWIVNGLDGRPQPIYGTADLNGTAEGAALSPDGLKVAFTLDTTDANSGKRTTQIYVVSLADGTYKALTHNPDGAYDPAWSPDGHWLAYAARSDGGSKTAIWAMRADGSDQHRLIDGSADRGPAWSPDGNQLAFVRLQGADSGLYYVDLTAPNGGLQAGSPQEIGNYSDVDPASGVSWTR